MYHKISNRWYILGLSVSEQAATDLTNIAYQQQKKKRQQSLSTATATKAWQMFDTELWRVVLCNKAEV